MIQISSIALALSGLLSPFLGVNASPTTRSAVAPRGLKFLGNSTRASVPMIKIGTESSKREINGHVPATRFRPRNTYAAAVGFEDEVNVPNR